MPSFTPSRSLVVVNLHRAALILAITQTILTARVIYRAHHYRDRSIQVYYEPVCIVFSCSLVTLVSTIYLLLAPAVWGRVPVDVSAEYNLINPTIPNISVKGASKEYPSNKVQDAESQNPLLRSSMEEQTDEELLAPSLHSPQVEQAEATPRNLAKTRMEIVLERFLVAITSLFWFVTFTAFADHCVTWGIEGKGAWIFAVTVVEWVVSLAQFTIQFSSIIGFVFPIIGFIFKINSQPPSNASAPSGRICI